MIIVGTDVQNANADLCLLSSTPDQVPEIMMDAMLNTGRYHLVFESVVP